ncbi:sterol 3-beta-glucosyltransferase UGT80B1 isoform X1 [Juglans microcarpa x Juglans regia]|uniref:sterol 3-beta-glucosyltransferase UGT80B1 isoform X1 n=1 Tax=Juglans microcarpa x Juglans regia TaxID=2249226 RepID=UPI001B7F50AC|nr:sterol 3-beta-glucosyltransferase UGT80B1 isoform X1 [Juglans microcarpa x Juglans regia]
MESEMEMEERNKPTAIFMAFGTKGDVYPVAAIAAAFACDQEQYSVVLITHSAHENLGHHLGEKHVAYYPISSPPVLSSDQDHETTTGPASLELSFLLQKRIVKREHRQECYSVVQRIFGCGPSLEGDFIAINFFALEGWSLAEMFRVRCIVVAPYVVPYSAPSSFERQFRKEEPLLYRYLQEAPINKVCWKDVIHWMWPLFTENWGSWRYDDLNLSPCPFTDPVTALPTWHDRPPSPLLLYGFSKEVVECPDYWPSTVRVCGFWFLPIEWQFSCKKCSEISALVSSGHLQIKDVLCSAHLVLQNFLEAPSTPPIFVGLSSVGSMGFLKNPQAFLRVLQTVIEITSYRFILFTAGFEPLASAVRMIAAEASSHLSQRQLSEDCISIFDGQLFCFTGSMPYKWLFPQCLAAIHHGGSGVTAAALHSGIPQVVCPFILDQFYWAERMFWLGVAPEPLNKGHLLPDKDDVISIQEAATVLSRAINNALSPRVKACAVEIAGRISLENGVLEAVKNLKEELSCPR